MKIPDVRTILLMGPCTNDPFLREARKLRSAAFSPHFKTRPWDIFLSNLDRFISACPLLNELSTSQLNGA